MVFDDGPIAGWNETDDPVPVHAPAPETRTHTDVGGIVTGPAEHREVRVTEPEQIHVRSMNAAAVFGIAIVLLAVGLYAGIGSIRGDVTAVEGGVATVSITQAGTFDPSVIDVGVGQVVTITNVNVNPQVLKSADTSRILFPVQVLFSTPYTFTIPASANGTYTYISETLPADRTLTINVSPATPIPFGTVTSSLPQSSTASDLPIPFGQSSSQHLEIPIPFGRSSSSSTTSSSTSSSSTSSSSSSSSSISSSSNSSSSTVTVSVGGGGGRTQWGGGVWTGGGQVYAGYNTPAYTAPPALPVNPYTVAAAGKPQSYVTAQGTKKTAIMNDNLKGGAPLTEHRPKTVSGTGPENMLLLFLPALLGVIVIVERRVRRGA